MNIGMSMGITQSQRVNCPECDQPEEHASGCTYGQIELLASKQRHIQCPNCQKRAVDENADGFWECRECNTQYTSSHLTVDTAEHTETMLVVDLDAPIGEGVQTVLQMQAKGEGNFPHDKKLEELRKQISQE
tara:strand:+ start:313 stop:708 length:396 start_codon:yes stop_codon:yes gene_type:complete